MRTAADDGGPDRDRTGDLLNAIQARSQLRHRPTYVVPRDANDTRTRGLTAPGRSGASLIVAP